MATLDRFTLTELVHEGKTFTVARALDARDGSRVVLKRLPSERGTPARVEQIRREHDILQGLSVPGVVRAKELWEHEGGLDLVLEDIGGETLGSFWSKQPLEIERFLVLASEIAETLGRVHGQHVIHKDINPSNILVGPEMVTQLIDFNLSTRLPREIPSLKNPELLEGTLPYISPEQTGRMSRMIDYRTDLYSLGATFYVMLTGRLPFPIRDPLELVHAHIARMPEPPRELVPSLPEVVSEIVMKLLQKPAEERYRSAFGLQADLDRCLAELRQSGRIEPFPLGQRDVHDRLQIPEKLYGREAPLALLEEAFGRVRTGKPELVLARGPSGVGKSAVVQELRKTLSRQRGLFAAGKFDQLASDMPYTALLQALREVCQLLLAEGEARLDVWRPRLREALGGLGRVVLDVLPELEMVIGPQPAVMEVEAGAAQSRFRYAFQRLFRALCPEGEPFVLFLDDLQWADSASLDLIARVVGDPEAGGLLLVGAYRDNEVTEAHPLPATVSAIEKDGCRVSPLAIEPLVEADIEAMLADTLAKARDEVRPLARLVWRKTRGNAFFAGQFLMSLYKSYLLRFDAERRAWTWDTEQIERAPTTDNVVELLVERARTLSGRARAVLGSAACLGAQFEESTLGCLVEGSAADLRAALAEAVEEGLVVPLGGGAYQFMHDRVQQAAAALLTDAARLDLHYRAARHLLDDRARRGGGDEGEGLFTLLSHANLVLDRFTAPEDRLALARLNLAAGRRARASAAFGPAAACFNAGIGLLPRGAVQREHALSAALYVGAAECEFGGGHFEAAEALFEIVRSEAKDDLQRAEILKLKSALYFRVGRMHEAIALLYQGLTLLGVDCPKRAGTPALLLEMLKVRRALGGMSKDDLAALPELTDPRAKLTLQLLDTVALQASSIHDPRLGALVGMRMLRMSLRHGICSQTITAYSYSAAILYMAFEDYERGNALIDAMYSLIKRYPDKGIEVRAMLSCLTVIERWRSHIDDVCAECRRAVEVALEAGDTDIAAVFASQAAVDAFFFGHDLVRSTEESEAALSLARRVRHLVYMISSQAFLRSIQILRGLPGVALGDEDEQRLLAECDRFSATMVRYGYQLAKMRILFLFHRYDEALALYKAMASDFEAVFLTQAMHAIFHNYGCLILAAACASAGPLERQSHLSWMRKQRRKLRRWAARAPMNLQHSHLLIEAEYARVTGEDRAAIGHYQAALSAARENRFMGDEALVLELMGEFYLSRGAADVGTMCLSRARRAYARWGAQAKVALMDAAYPGLERLASPASEATPEPIDISTTASTSARAALDAPSMIKASQALSGEISVERLLSRLMQVIVESAGAERGALLLRRGAGQDLRVEAELSPEGGARVLGSPVPLTQAEGLSAAIVQYVARTQKSVVLVDAAREGAFVKDPYIEANRPRSVLCMPLVRQGEVNGVLYLENNLAASAFTEERVELLRVMCVQMAISVENAFLYANLELKVAERTAELREAQALVVKLEKEATEVQMAGGFAHELRNALGGAKMLLEAGYRAGGETLCVESAATLRGLFLEVKPHLPEEQLTHVVNALRKVNGNEKQLDEILGRVNTSLARALGITNLILEYSRLGSEAPGTEEVPLRALIEEALRAAAPDSEGEGITVEIAVPPDEALRGRAEHFEVVARNLLRNAREAILERDDQGPRVIRVEAEARGREAVLRVVDTGVGIAKEDQPRIFAPFFSTKPASGTGLGLGMVQKVVSIYQGTITFESKVGKGTTFSVTLPRWQEASARGARRGEVERAELSMRP